MNTWLTWSKHQGPHSGSNRGDGVLDVTLGLVTNRTKELDGKLLTQRVVLARRGGRDSNRLAASGCTAAGCAGPPPWASPATLAAGRDAGPPAPPRAAARFLPPRPRPRRNVGASELLSLPAGEAVCQTPAPVPRPRGGLLGTSAVAVAGGCFGGRWRGVSGGRQRPPHARLGGLWRALRRLGRRPRPAVSFARRRRCVGGGSVSRCAPRATRALAPPRCGLAGSAVAVGMRIGLVRSNLSSLANSKTGHFFFTGGQGNTHDPPLPQVPPTRRTSRECGT